jgi:hypothetical protein
MTVFIAWAVVIGAGSSRLSPPDQDRQYRHIGTATEPRTSYRGVPMGVGRRLAGPGFVGENTSIGVAESGEGRADRRTLKRRRQEDTRAIEHERRVALIAAEGLGERLRANPSATAEEPRSCPWKTTS